MTEKHILLISQELKLKDTQVRATAQLLAEGGTVPFIARYRKEATGTLDEVAITNIRDRLQQLTELDARREAILKSLQERNLLTEELEKKIVEAETLTVLEDIYQPYRPKKRTRATIAKEKGLEPLALFILENQDADPVTEAEKFISEEKDVKDVESALSGARDIIAEMISDDAAARQSTRKIYLEEGVIFSEIIKGKEEEGSKFKDYFKWSEPLAKIPSHRLLAIRRGEKEGFLMMRIEPTDEQRIITTLEKLFVKGTGRGAAQIKEAISDSLKRLLGPSIETEARLQSKKHADDQAIIVFTQNLRELLLASPLGQKNVLAIDPGFRTGCKVVCLDAQGKLLHNDVVYLGQSDNAAQEAALKIRRYCEHFKIEAIAIGNGTASRESETFVRELKLPASIAIVMVNESGASIYSASDVAREEFPDQDITVRGAVSIGRRLMDPLAELVKIDPKSIGVGQYQHDVDQNQLKQALDDVVISSVNGVGVELNTASKELLSYVSGLNRQIAANVVAYRNEKGAFHSRKELLKVGRLGPKAYEQCAGFLRIRGGDEVLDASAVHPERYEIVHKMAKDLGCEIADLMGASGQEKRKMIKIETYVSADVGLPTLKDIIEELAKPGRDPRKEFEFFKFSDEVHEMSDLKEGMRLPGIVTNVTAFGAFVDIGVHQDGLVHVSHLSDQFVTNASDVVKVQQRVMVTVLEVDIPRKRIALSMKTNPEKQAKAIGSESKERPKGGFSNQQRPAPAPVKKALNDDWFSSAMKKK